MDELIIVILFVRCSLDSTESVRRLRYSDPFLIAIVWNVKSFPSSPVLKKQ